MVHCVSFSETDKTGFNSSDFFLLHSLSKTTNANCMLLGWLSTSLKKHFYIQTNGPKQRISLNNALR